jgi:hypothetical protein
MPAEAIHLSALGDLRARAPARVTRALAPPACAAAVRVGAMFVDLPYFDRFGRGLVRYVLGLPQASSPWGDRFHQQAPIALGIRIAETGARLSRTAATREVGEALVALAVGYTSHAAVDAALHPLVNRLAIARGARLGTPGFTREHQEVEKYQSVLFHEARYGVDYLGTAALRDFVTIDWRMLERGGFVVASIHEATRAILGVSPRPRELARWTSGYRFFVSVLSGPLGRRAVTAEDKARERAAVFEDCDYGRRYEHAVRRSLSWVEALLAYVDEGRFGDDGRAALARVMPEQSLDPPPEAMETAAA